jgi:acyl-[acyl-carrier-protein]-phospholipid O-acyltransferase/long-chain-fatty-acid--[acyl-carrier-protein] ligase
MKSPRASLAALLTAQAQETFNDCAAKMMLGALAQQLARASGQDSKPVLALIAALLVLPYIAFGPVCGWLSDRFPKRSVLNWTLVSQIGVMLLLVAALWLKSFWGAMFGFFLLSAETAVLAPAKRGILLEYVGPQRLSRWVGYMEMFNITAILVGSFAGGALFSHWFAAGGDLWQAALNTAWVLTALAVIAWAFFQVADPTESKSAEPFRWSLWVRHFTDIFEVQRTRPLWRATMGICFFYGVGGYATVLLQQVGYELTHGGPAAALTSSKLLLMVGFGTMVGNLLAGLISRRGVELGLAPLGGAMLAVALVALGYTAPGTTQFNVLLVATGFSSGFFLVPLYAFIQERAGDHRRGRILAGVSLLDSIAGMAAAAIYGLVASDAALGWPVSTQFLLMAAVTLAMLAYALYHLPHQTVCTVMRLFGRIFYKVRVLGRDQMPAGGALVLCNHLSYVDAVVLQIASPRPLRFVAFAGFAKSPTVRFLFRAAGVIPVNPDKPLKGIRVAWDALKAGELVCVFPEGAISRTGQLMELREGFETIVRHTKVPVVPAAIDGLWGSIYSFAGNRYLWKSPRLMPTPVCVVFGPPIASERADGAHMRKAMLDVGELAFQERPMLKRHLGREIVRALAKRPRHVELVDRTAERRPVTAAQLLAVAAALSRHLRKTVPARRIGIVLPPGAGAHIANLAVAFAGKVPVNLNFTAGKAAIETSLKLGEIDTVITADAMRAKIPNFPFPADTRDLKKIIEAAGGKRAIVPWLLAAWLLPNQWVANLLDLPKVGDREEAALLFTSGSSGEPKGVVLTHRNLFANCAQISSLSILPDTAVLMACLPVFHSFGFTVTLWYPLLRGCKVITVPSPLDTKKIVEAIQQEKATVMLGAPTFVRPFLKKASKEELRSLELVVTGAEKLTMDLYEAFLGQFGIEILQGYGLTETTPATNINQHNPPITTATAEEQLGKRTGAVGRLMPGMTARIVDPDTGEELPMTSTGMLWLRGANVFPGYLKDPEKTAAALKDGWFITGDLGRFDNDGFLFIEGRLSRFSKIGGEMVPHGTIEQRIVDLFGWDQQEGPTAVVTGIPDPAKGEALVLLTTKDVTLEQLRAKLLESGLPNLWVPKILRKVDKIPMLGTGKTDLKAVRNLALELTKGTVES